MTNSLSQRRKQLRVSIARLGRGPHPIQIMYPDIDAPGR
jgi:hypothetical protein